MFTPPPYLTLSLVSKPFLQSFLKLPEDIPWGASQFLFNQVKLYYGQELYVLPVHPDHAIISCITGHL